MKKILIYLLPLIAISCSQRNHEKSETLLEKVSKDEAKTTSTVVNSNSGSGSNTTYTLTNATNGVICNFKGYWSLAWQPTGNVNAGLHFEKAGNKVDDTLNTQLFSKYLDLNNVKGIKIDSMAYKVIDEEIKLKFIVSLIRNENKENKAVEKYFFVYSSSFKDPEPTIVVDKVEKTSVEVFSNTY